MLKNIFDNRSGRKLEIVIPVLNEKKRIEDIFKYYSDDFDIVLLDGGSTDGTRDIAEKYNATFYRRMDESLAENYFIYYINKKSKSERCFYMFADEFVEIGELKKIEKLLEEENTVVYGNRVDWVYCKKRKSYRNNGVPRAAENAKLLNYDPLRLHDGISTNGLVKAVWLDVHHFHLWSMKRYFGTAGAYAYIEVERMRSEKNFTFNFFKRFFYNELIKFPYRIIRWRHLGVARLLWIFFMSFIISLLGVVSYIEQKFLKTEQEQLNFYKDFYSGNSDV